jgi:hypothetical protein
MAAFCIRLEIEIAIKHVNAKYVLSLSSISKRSLFTWTDSTSVCAADIYSMLFLDPKLISSSSSS